MTKKAILHICLSTGWGGLEMYPIRVGKEFIQRGYKVYGLCVSGTQVAEGMEKVGIETFQVKSKKNLIAFQIIKLNQWLKKNNIDVVHCHKSGDILVSALLSLLKKRQTLFTEHMGVTRPKKDIYHKLVYSHIEQVLSISNETLKRNLNALPVSNKKIARLWLGTDIPEAPIKSNSQLIQTKTKLGIPESSLVVGTVGRICSGKGQLELIKAFELVAKSFPSTHLLVVGGLDIAEGSDNSYVELVKSKVSSSLFSDRIHLAGFQKDTQAMYSIMDVVSLPYHNEAFGLTAIEAMAAKKAIVGANTGALPEILDGVSLLCSPNDPKAIAKKLETYLNNASLRHENAKKAYLRAKKHFSMEKHINSLESYLT
ncbi:glycosyltransferase family 4 protein [Vibrio sp. HN007]|uniref:glycosyltransferase family 4 protein n=1 Tax=Vibrio iocasae TaxID=3098914 RepID=UPI0035D40D0B